MIIGIGRISNRWHLHVSKVKEGDKTRIFNVLRVLNKFLLDITQTYFEIQFVYNR